MRGNTGEVAAATRVIDLRGLDSLRSRIDKVLSVVRTIIGVPNYDRYVQHMCEHNPGQAPLSRKEFELDRLKAKYFRPGSRCC